MVLRAGDGLERKLLTNHVRALFGFSRTGQNLEAAIGAAIDALLADEIVGEGSTGIRLREEPALQLGPAKQNERLKLEEKLIYRSAC